MNSPSWILWTLIAAVCDLGVKGQRSRDDLDLDLCVKQKRIDLRAEFGKLLSYEIKEDVLPRGARIVKVAHETSNGHHDDSDAWLRFDSAHRRLEGVAYPRLSAPIGAPTTTTLLVTAIATVNNRTNTVACKIKMQFRIAVFWSSSSTVANGDSNGCHGNPADVRVLLSDVLDVDERIELIKRFSAFLNYDPRALTLMPYSADYSLVLAFGKGNVQNVVPKTALSWSLNCGNYVSIMNLAQIMEHLVDSGRLVDEIGFDVMKWTISGTEKLRRRKRAVVATPTLTSLPPTATSDVAGSTSISDDVIDPTTAFSSDVITQTLESSQSTITGTSRDATTTGTSESMSESEVSSMETIESSTKASSMTSSDIASVTSTDSVIVTSSDSEVVSSDTVSSSDATSVTSSDVSLATSSDASTPSDDVSVTALVTSTDVVSVTSSEVPSVTSDLTDTTMSDTSQDVESTSALSEISSTLSSESTRSSSSELYSETDTTAEETSLFSSSDIISSGASSTETFRSSDVESSSSIQPSETTESEVVETETSGSDSESSSRQTRSVIDLDSSSGTDSIVDSSDYSTVSEMSSSDDVTPSFVTSLTESVDSATSSDSLLSEISTVSEVFSTDTQETSTDFMTPGQSTTFIVVERSSSSEEEFESSSDSTYFSVLPTDSQSSYYSSDSWTKSEYPTSDSSILPSDTEGTSDLPSESITDSSDIYWSRSGTSESWTLSEDGSTLWPSTEDSVFTSQPSLSISESTDSTSDYLSSYSDSSPYMESSFSTWDSDISSAYPSTESETDTLLPTESETEILLSTESVTESLPSTESATETFPSTQTESDSYSDTSIWSYSDSQISTDSVFTDLTETKTESELGSTSDISSTIESSTLMPSSETSSGVFESSDISSTDATAASSTSTDASDLSASSVSDPVGESNIVDSSTGTIEVTTSSDLESSTSVIATSPTAIISESSSAISETTDSKGTVSGTSSFGTVGSSTDIFSTSRPSDVSDVTSTSHITSSQATSVMESSPSSTEIDSSSETSSEVVTTSSTPDMTSTVTVTSSSSVVTSSSSAAVTSRTDIQPSSTTDVTDSSTAGVLLPPTIVKHLDIVYIHYKHYFSIPLPQMFYDVQDGYDLDYQLLDGNMNPHTDFSWISLDSEQRILEGIAWNSTIGNRPHQFVIVATNSRGLSAQDAFMVIVQGLPDLISKNRTHYFRAKFALDYQTYVNDSREIGRLTRRIADYFYSDAQLLYMDVLQGSLILQWTNTSASCRTLGELKDTLIYPNGSVRTNFSDYMEPEYPIQNLTFRMTGTCEAVVTGTDPSMLIAILLPVILILLVIICALSCLIYRRREQRITGKVFLDEGNHNESVYKHERKPIILPDDFELGQVRASRMRARPPMTFDNDGVSFSFDDGIEENGETERRRPSAPEYRRPREDEDAITPSPPPSYSSQPPAVPQYKTPPPYFSRTENI